MRAGGVRAARRRRGGRCGGGECGCCGALLLLLALALELLYYAHVAHELAVFAALQKANTNKVSICCVEILFLGNFERLEILFYQLVFVREFHVFKLRLFVVESFFFYMRRFCFIQ